MRTCTCPNCNAALSFNEDREFGFCEYCGTKIMLDDYRTTQRIIDEAKIKQAEVEREVRLRELEIEESRMKQQIRVNTSNSRLNKTITVIWIIISVIIIIIGIGIMFSPGSEEFPGWLAGFLFLAYVGGPIVGGGGVFVFKFLPSKEADKRALQAGGIRFPKSLEPFSGKDYETVRTILSNSGFTNITCTNLHDIKLGLLKKQNRIESIFVDGEDIKSAGKVYMPNACIVITYHGH